MRLLVLSLLASLAFSPISHGQSLDQVIKVGNQSFDTKDYYNAFRCYEMVLDYVKKGKYKGDWDPLYIKYRYAEAAQRFNYFEKADLVYTELLAESQGDNNNMDVYARSTFNLARVKQSLAEEEASALNAARLNVDTLEAARELFQRFQKENLAQHLKSFPASGKEEPAALSQDAQLAFLDAAQKGEAEVNETIKKVTKNPAGATLEKDTISRLPDIVNSEYSDLAPVLRGNDLYFASVKFSSNPDRLLRQSRIYSQVLKASYSRNTEGGLDTIIRVDTLAQGGFFNDSEDFSHTLHTAITQNGEWMYFSHCPQGRGEDPNCTMYRRKNTGGAWSTPEYLSINVDSTRFTTTQPSISYDPRTGEQWLYFTSDRSGTKGLLDIWRCPVDQATGSLGSPESVDGVNSEWNDATPFMHALSGQLFFSSDRESTFGLYDIFVWKSCDSERVIENMGLPYNSGYNDQYYFLSEDGGRAFFSSDRPESTRFIDSLNACCQDIYTYPIDIDVELKASVYGCEEEDITGTADITVYDITNCDCKTGNLVEGNRLRRYHTYKIFASHDEYQTDSTTIKLDFDCSGEGEEKIQVDFQLAPQYVDLTVEVVDSTTGVPLALEEYTLAITSEGAAPVSERGNQTYRLNPQFDYVLEVKAKADIYMPKTVPLDRATLTSACTDTILIKMAPCFPDSLKGIIFYFDNDKPSRIVREKWTTTNERFNQDLLDPYLKQQKKYRDFNLKPISVKWEEIKDSLRFENRFGGDGVDTLLSFSNPSSESSSEEIPLRFFVRKSKNGTVQVVPDEVTVGGRIDRFFERDLEGNLKRFNNLIQYIKGYLETGNELDIDMRAYCSIRVSDIKSTYNDSLALRRIRCIESTIRESLGRAWNEEGVSESKRLEYDALLNINRQALSDSKAAKNFPDPNLDPSADEGGKYFLSAALDRRVEITSISIKSCNSNDDNLSSQVTIENP